ncbi:MAG: hypothetical protein WBV82_29310 [Myxococcaceae bacterium]
MSRANFRDYASALPGICTAEPQWLQDELSSVNGLLARWLDKTSAGYDGAWSSDELKLLQQGAETVGPVLEIHAGNLVALRDCAFGKARAFPELIRRGETYIEQARQRMREADSITAWRISKKAIELWQQEQPTREANAKRGCPDRVVYGKAQIYYAIERDDGQVRWLFCDGAQVRSLAEGGTELQVPDDLTQAQRRRIKARKYLEAASDFPASRIDRPPSLPERLDTVSEHR